MLEQLVEQTGVLGLAQQPGVDGVVHQTGGVGCNSETSQAIVDDRVVVLGIKHTGDPRADGQVEQEPVGGVGALGEHGLGQKRLGQAAHAVDVAELALAEQFVPDPFLVREGLGDAVAEGAGVDAVEELVEAGRRHSTPPFLMPSLIVLSTFAVFSAARPFAWAAASSSPAHTSSEIRPASIMAPH